MMRLELLQAYSELEKIHRAFDGAALELMTARAAPLCVEKCGKCCYCVHAWGVEGQYVLSVIAGNGSLTRIMGCCEAWLLDRHSGVTTYGLKPGRVPQGEWQNKLGDEVAALMRSPCPLLDSDKRCTIYDSRPITCLAYGTTRMAGRECPRPLGVGESETVRAYYSGPGSMALRNRVTRLIAGLRTQWASSWFLPTLLYSMGKPGNFKALIEDSKIASVKLLVGGVSPDIIWQEQLERVWSRSTN